jgi:phosphopentomutase
VNTLRVILTFVILIILFGCSSSAQVKNNIIKEIGFIIFHENDLIFIPSEDSLTNIFFESYKGDTGYLINDKGYFSRLRDSSNKYHVVTNYLIGDSLISEEKEVWILPVTITSQRADYSLQHTYTDLLLRINDKDFMFNYCTYSFRKIIDIHVRNKNGKPGV